MCKIVNDKNKKKMKLQGIKAKIKCFFFCKEWGGIKMGLRGHFLNAFKVIVQPFDIAHFINFWSPLSKNAFPECTLGAESCKLNCG